MTDHVRFVPFKGTPPSKRLQDRPDATIEQQKRERRDYLRDLQWRALERMDTADGWADFLVARYLNGRRAADPNSIRNGQTPLNCAMIALQNPGRRVYTVSELGSDARGRTFNNWTVGRGYSPTFTIAGDPEPELPVPDLGECERFAREWTNDPGEGRAGKRNGKAFRRFCEAREAELDKATGDPVPVVNEEVRMPESSAPPASSDIPF